MNITSSETTVSFMAHNCSFVKSPTWRELPSTSELLFKSMWNTGHSTWRVDILLLLHWAALLLSLGETILNKKSPALLKWKHSNSTFPWDWFAGSCFLAIILLVLASSNRMDRCSAVTLPPLEYWYSTDTVSLLKATWPGRSNRRYCTSPRTERKTVPQQY